MTVTRIMANGGILVAHDGSSHSTAAVRLGVRHAVALNVPVTVVRCWSIATAPRPESWTFGYVPPLDDFEAATLAALDRDIAAIRDAHPDADITTQAVHGKAVQKLLEASSQVELIVVGNRGRGGFAGLRLGSVSEQIARNAECSVLISRHTGDPAETGEDDVEVELDVLEQALLSELKLDQ